MHSVAHPDVPGIGCCSLGAQGVASNLALKLGRILICRVAMDCAQRVRLERTGRVLAQPINTIVEKGL